MLGLRTCDKNGKSYGKFKWPLEVGAVVEAPDWNPEPVCGGGLHFLPWGEGDGQLLDWSDDAKALVVRPLTKVVDIDGAKSKARKCKVVAVFDSIPEAAGYIANKGGQGKTIAGVTATAGYYGTATAGYYGTATAGNRGTATAGYGGTATAGYYGTATAGNRGTATAGYYGTATAGYYGTATAGNRGTATAGYYGTIICCRWDGERRRYEVGYIGETLDMEGNVLEPGKPYRLNDEGKFVRAS